MKFLLQNPIIKRALRFPNMEFNACINSMACQRELWLSVLRDALKLLLEAGSLFQNGKIKISNGIGLM